VGCNDPDSASSPPRTDSGRRDRSDPCPDSGRRDRSDPWHTRRSGSRRRVGGTGPDRVSFPPRTDSGHPGRSRRHSRQSPASGRRVGPAGGKGPATGRPPQPGGRRRRTRAARGGSQAASGGRSPRSRGGQEHRTGDHPRQSSATWPLLVCRRIVSWGTARHKAGRTWHLVRVVAVSLAAARSRVIGTTPVGRDWPG
jgi:hypothetical protein